MISLKSSREIESIRRASEIVKAVFELLEREIRPGAVTLELDRLAEKFIRSRNAFPAFKGYRGFPASLCTSVNHEVIHGIPSNRKLREGDIVSIDLGVQYEGFFSDAARTYPVGKVSPEARKLIEVTRQAFWAGIQGKRAGHRVGDISADIQEYVESRGYSVVRDFVGHGIGRELHEDPQIPNFGKRGRGVKLEQGLVLAIEPMVNQGTWQVRVLEDSWTAVTADGRLSAHHEETVVVREDKLEVLT